MTIWHSRTIQSSVLLVLLFCTFRQTAVRVGALLAPVGLAWARAQELNSELILHHRDGRHANPMGAYLTACVFYAVLLNSNPEGLPASVFIEGKRRPEQESAQALLLQQAAWETVLNSEVGMRKSEKDSRLKD